MTTIEKIQRVATLRGNKYMSPEMISDDKQLLDELSKSGDVIDLVKIGHRRGSFNFPKEHREEYERIYNDAWTKQMNNHTT